MIIPFEAAQAPSVRRACSSSSALISSRAKQPCRISTGPPANDSSGRLSGIGTPKGRTAQTIARELGIDDVRAGLNPEDKVVAIRELEREYGAVAMIGDGVNDAPALAQATIGMAMGTAGTDAAIEAADVALMADDLEKVGYALRIGRKARLISRQNIAFSLALLAVLIPGAAAGLFTIAIAVTVHETAELIAVANGLRAARA